MFRPDSVSFIHSPQKQIPENVTGLVGNTVISMKTRHGMRCYLLTLNGLREFDPRTKSLWDCRVEEAKPEAYCNLNGMSFTTVYKRARVWPVCWARTSSPNSKVA